MPSVLPVYLPLPIIRYKITRFVAFDPETRVKRHATMTPQSPFDGFGSSLVTLSLHIASVDRDRERYRDLLLLADEQWDMVERYLRRGDMYAAFGWGDLGCASAESSGLTPMSGAESELSVRPAPVLGCMIVTDEGVDASGARIAEVKNLASLPSSSAAAWSRLLDFAATRYAPTHGVLQVGTGDSPLTVPFYETCGFARSHVLPISSSTTTTIRLSRREFSSGTWCICVAPFPQGKTAPRAARFQRGHLTEVNRVSLPLAICYRK